MARKFLSASTQHGDSTSVLSAGLGTADFTLAFWLKTYSHASGYMAVWANGTYNPCFYHTKGGVGKSTFYPNETQFDTAFTDDTSDGTSGWVHVIFQRVGTVGTVYINGTAESTTLPVGSNTYGAAATQRIGSSASSGEYGNFQISSLGLWTRALNSTERGNLATDRWIPELIPTNLVWALRFNEASASDNCVDAIAANNLVVINSPAVTTDPAGLVTSLGGATAHNLTLLGVGG